jgi:RNA polymerase sigma factor (sigma-70 family)
MSECSLWSSFKNGSKKSFEDIYNLYVQQLYHYGCRLSSDKELVEDAIQELFVELWSKREKLGDTDSVKFYLLKCLRRKIVKEINLHDKVELGENYHFEFSQPYEHTLISQEKNMQHSHELDYALRKLTKRQRESIYLKFNQNLSIEEISALMSLSLKATYNLLSKSIVTLRQLLKFSKMPRTLNRKIAS